MLSTKSRLATHPPGAKKRTSIDFSRIYPSTAGQTTGLSMRETQHFAGSSSLDENGNTMSDGGGFRARRSNSLAAFKGTTFLSSAAGSPTSAT